MIDIDHIYDKASALFDTDQEQAIALLSPLLEAQRSNREALFALTRFMRKHEFPHETGLEYLTSIYECHADEDEVLIEIGTTLGAAKDTTDLNAPPPNHPLFGQVIQQLAALAEKSKGQDDEVDVVESLSSAARLAGRHYDVLAEEQYTRLVELLPDTYWAHYNMGLFYKTRGRFEEGLLANQKAQALVEEENEAVIWNLGICATGAGKGEIALDMWKGIGNKIEMGRFGLPDGSYYSCKVKLAQFPIAERTAENDYPGLEETIWIERLSPCHGIIRSVLYQDLGVDYGDVILIDGAPITFHTYGEDSVAVFPHLATLVRSNYHFYDFAATQSEKGEINNLDKAIEEDIVIYSHTENFRYLCSACWRNQGLDHAQHTEKEEKHIVTGRIAAPPEISPSVLLDLIDSAQKEKPLSKIYAPALCEAANQHDRAFVEQHRYEMLK